MILTWLSLNLYVCSREKKQKIQDIKNNIKEAIEVSDCVHDIFYWDWSNRLYRFGGN